MRVLHLCPLWFPAARDAAGGVETFLPQLISALERQGCHGALLATGDSHTEAELVPVTPRNLWAQMAEGTAGEYAYFEQQQLLLALERASDFDVVHSHLGPGAYVLSGVPGVGERVLHTQHNPVTPDLEWFVRQHPRLWFSTVSQLQARRLRQSGAERCEVIPNGIDVRAFEPDRRGGPGLLFLGRMEWDKGPDLAVEVARAIGRPLVLAGPLADEAFFARRVEPFLGGEIRYVGTVDHRQKRELLAGAGCVLMPSRWEEPFGLVAVEAMACGTPVVALANGALPEIVEPGLTGYLASAEGGLPELATAAMGLDRCAVRARVAARFDMPVVAARYRELYARIAAARPPRP